MEVSAPGRRRGSRNYTQEFREMVVAQANDPARSIADVAQEHGLNANMVAKWRRERSPAQSTALLPAPESFLPVQIAPSSKQQPAITVERGAVRVRFEGTPDLDVLRVVLATHLTRLSFVATYGLPSIAIYRIWTVDVKRIKSGRGACHNHKETVDSCRYQGMDVRSMDGSVSAWVRHRKLLQELRVGVIIDQPSQSLRILGVHDDALLNKP
ncbi:transposase [Burkholderia sp. R-69608]|nr:transposase [Burkholderia sp. R-69608]